MAEQCTVCDEMIEPSTQAWSENTCGVHYAHTACVREHQTEHACKECDPSSVKKIEEPTLEPVEGDLDEPCLEPVPPKIALPSYGIFSGIKRFTSKFARDDVETSVNPFFLVRSHYPVKLFSSKKKMMLHHLVNDHGISIGDFVESGYTFEELVGFPEIDAKGGLDVLIGMGLNHENLYTHRKELPLKALRQKYGLTTKDVIDKMGYKFSTPEDGGWSAKYLIAAGFNIDQLMSCGLKYKYEFDGLDLTMDQATQLGVKQSHLEKLKSKVVESGETHVPVTRRSDPVRCIRRVHNTDPWGQSDSYVGQGFGLTCSPPAMIKGRRKKKKKAVPPPRVTQSSDIGYVRTVPRPKKGKLVFPGDALRKQKNVITKHKHTF